MSSCKPCIAGFYLDASLGRCVACALGSVSLAGSTSCVLCAAGTIAATTASSLCMPCARGYYAESTGSSSCFQCSTGTTADVGANSSSQCSLFLSSSISFGAGAAGGSVATMNLRVQCAFSIPLAKHIVLGLPGFQMANAEPVLDGSSSSKFTASWVNATQSLPYPSLVLTSMALIQPAEHIEIIVPAAAGLVLPTYGIAPNDKRLTLATDAIVGSMEAQPVEQVQAVGSMGISMALTVQVGLDGSLALSFGALFEMDVRIGERVEILLGYFQGPDDGIVSLSGSSASIFGGFASWDGAVFGSSAVGGLISMTVTNQTGIF